MLNEQKYKGVLKEYVQYVFDVKGIKEYVHYVFAVERIKQHVHYIFVVEGIKMTIFGDVIEVQSKTKNARRRDCFTLCRVVRRKIKQNQTTTKSNIAKCRPNGEQFTANSKPKANHNY